MKVIICGAGQVGWQIARHLAGEKNDVTIIDLTGVATQDIAMARLVLARARSEGMVA